ncbi:autotransporter domain-containing protein [Tistrella mobilis]|uniref:autotransporter domain-containing protein n=1 Tax=Tistrella mobilis TaxID=171437 RepID=UPI003555D78F
MSASGRGSGLRRCKPGLTCPSVGLPAPVRLRHVGGSVGAPGSGVGSSCPKDVRIMAGHPRSLRHEVDLSRRLIHLRRRLMAGAAMTVMVWGAGSRDEVLAETIPVGSGDTPLRLEELSDLPTTVEITAGASRTVTGDAPAVSSETAGWTLENGGEITAEGLAVGLVGSTLVNGSDGRITGAAGVQMADPDGTAGLGVENAGVITGQAGAGLVAGGSGLFALDNQTSGAIFAAGPALAVQAAEAVVGNDGTIQSSRTDGALIDAGNVILANGANGVIIGDAIGLGITGGAVEVTNAGTIAGGVNSAQPVAGGIAIQADTATVRNEAGGTVLGREAGVTVEASDTAEVVNGGALNGVMIDGDAQALLRNLAGGSITAETDNLVTGRGIVRVENAGTIEAGSPGRSSEIGLIAGTREGADRPAETILINETGGRITGFNGAAVLSGDVIRIENRGTIDGILAPAVSATADVTHVVNEGLVAGGTGFLIDGDATLTNAAAGEILTWGAAVFTTGAADVVNAGQIITVHGVVPADVPDGAVAVGSGSHVDNLAGGVILNRRWSGIAVSDGMGDEDPADRETVIENAGLIRSEGSGRGVIVDVAGRVTVSNRQGGNILSAGAEGILLQAGTAIIDNAGAIIGGSADEDAQMIAGLAVLGDRTVVTNRVGAIIAGDGMGVSLAAADEAAIENAGFINGMIVDGGMSTRLDNAATGVVAAYEQNGLLGEAITVDNAGVIQGGVSALVLGGDAGRVVNTGTIEGGSGAGIASITTAGTSVANSGAITGGVVGIGTEGGLTLENSGRISGGFVAVKAVGGSTIDNRAGGEIVSEGSAIEIVGEALITNAGLIRSEQGIAITVEGDAVVDNAAGGVIEAAGPALLLAGTASLTNAGRISSTDPTFGGDDAEGVAILAGSGGLIANTGVIESGAGAVMIGDVADEANEFETAVANDGLIQARGAGVALAADIVGGLEIANTNTIVAADGPAMQVVAGEVLLGNGGVIVSDGGTGVRLQANTVSVSNGAGALIRGGGGGEENGGMAILGRTVDISNAGVITGVLTGLGAAGEEVTVTNDIDGVIAGDIRGLGLAAARNATIDNAGYISGLMAAAGDGVLSLQNGETGVIAGNAPNILAGPQVVVDNAGLISGNTGLLIEAGSVVISNSGRITGVDGPTDGLEDVGDLDSSIGIVALVDGTAEIDNSGTISGSVAGVLIEGDLLLENTGTISGGEAGVSFVGGSIHNAEGGVISGGSGIVLLDPEALAGLINAGVIQAIEDVAVNFGSGAIYNSGSIVSLGRYDEDDPLADPDEIYAAVLLEGGSLVNAAGGVISGAEAGVVDLGDAYGDGATVRNEGQILAGVAVTSFGDGFVLENIGGRIAGSIRAVDLSGEDVTIVNQAGLIDGGLWLSGNGAVVDNRAGGVMIRTGARGEDGEPDSAVIDLLDVDGAVVTNAGLIAGNDADGIDAGLSDESAWASLEVTNLSGARIAGVTAIDADVDTLDIDNAGFLTGEDYGVYATADDVSIVNRAGGEITGGISAIDVEGGFDVENAGAISGGNDERHTPVMFLVGDGTLTNAAGGRISGGVAISADADGLVDVVNAGVIEAERLAIQVGGESYVENQADGLISGALGIAFTNSIDPEALLIDTPTLINRGEIRGGVVYDAGMVNIADIGGRLGANEEGWALLFSDDADERWLTLRDGAVIDGDILAGETNDLDAARDREDSVATFEGGGSFAHDLSGFGLIEKEGAGTWRFSGNLLAAAFDVNEGGVRLDGRFTGDEMTVGTGGTLSGNGTIDGDLVSEGRVAPGNSIGTITVTGDFTQAATGTLAMEYAADGAGGTVTDRLVVGGAATIEGGTLSLTSFDGSTPRYASTELITAADGITGTFDTVETDRAGLVGRLLADGDVISLRLVDTENGFRALATTRNARNVATVLETQGLTATGDRDQLLSELAALGDADAAAALGDLAGSEYAGHWRYLRGTGRAFVDGAANAGRAGHRGAWITGFGNTGRTSGEDDAGDLRWRSAGTAVGIDFAVGETARLGIAAGVTDGRTTARSRDAGIDTTGWHVGAYGAVPAGPVTLDAVVAYTRSSSDADRSITGTGRTARGSFDTDQVTAAIGISTDLVVPGAKPGTPEAAAGAPSWTVTPMLRLIYDRQKSDDVTETGAGAAALVVQGGTVEGLEAFAGVRFSTAYGDAAKGETVIRPSFTLGIGQELLDRDQTLTAHFAGDPANPFQVTGISQGRTTGRIGAGVEADVAPGVTVGVGYAGAIDETGGDHRLTAGLRFSW